MQSNASPRPVTYRAAVCRHIGGGETVLTAPIDADKTDEQLLTLARHEAAYAGIDFDSADIVITEWTDRFGA